jgi:hypothetical protein
VLVILITSLSFFLVRGPVILYHNQAAAVAT